VYEFTPSPEKFMRDYVQESDFDHLPRPPPRDVVGNSVQRNIPDRSPLAQCHSSTLSKVQSDSNIISTPTLTFPQTYAGLSPAVPSSSNPISSQLLSQYTDDCMKENSLHGEQNPEGGSSRFSTPVFSYFDDKAEELKHQNDSPWVRKHHHEAESCEKPIYVRDYAYNQNSSQINRNIYLEDM
jgi:hypothetical protein